jgi:WD40-like Beta Propeller Repeat
VIGSLLLFAGLAVGAEPEPITLPARALKLPTDAAHLRVDGGQLYVSGFHSQKLVTATVGRKKSVKELPLDAFEDYRTDPDGCEVREVRRAAGGDLVLAAGKLFVAQVFQGSVLVVDRDTFTPVRRLPLGGEGCLAASPDGRTVYFASNSEPEFHIIETRTYKHRNVAYPRDGRGIGCLAVSPDGKRLYLGIQRGGRMPDGTRLSGGNAFLAAYDLTKGEYAGTAFLARKRPDGSGDDGVPTSLAFAPDGKRLYVGTFQCEAGVLVVDPLKMRVVDNIYIGSKDQMPAFPWVDPMSVAVFDRWLLVAVRHNREVAVFDLATHRVVARLAADASDAFERVVVEGGRVYLSGGSRTLSVIQAKHLSRLLSAVDAEKTGAVRVRMAER